MSPKPYDGSPPSTSHLFPTPPSTAGFSSHMHLADMNMANMNNPSDTPVQNTPSSVVRDNMEQEQDQGDTPMMDAPDHRRSDHERSSLPPLKAAPYAIPLICRTAVPVSRPHPSQNLISLYGLDSLASKVVRKDDSGKKINKLRKSYEGKVKEMGLPGRNKATINPGELMGFMEWPEDMWYDQKIRGKELEHATESPMMEKLAKALQMNPGKLLPEEDAKWKGLIAFDDSNTKTPVQTATSRNPVHQAMSKAQPTSMRASAPASPRAHQLSRHDRTNKKRSYVESSYEGYQDDDGYSTGGLDDKRNSAAKKRRKDFSPSLEGSASSFKNGVLGLGLKSS